jgi:hypothetical protein
VARALLRTVLALFLWVAGVGSPIPLQGQTRAAPLTLQLSSPQRPPILLLGPVVEGTGVQESLESGLPIRIHVTMELWRVRTFDALEGRESWRATLRLDPLTGRTLLAREGVEGERSFPSLAAARTALQNSLSPTLRPEREGRFYYIARIEVETLSLSDLDELRRWLRGDLGPAVEGEGGVAGALGRGTRRLLVRALRLPVERFETRTPTFESGGSG